MAYGLWAKAPKADALPGCATPRHAKTLSFPAVFKASSFCRNGTKRDWIVPFGIKSPTLSPHYAPDLFSFDVEQNEIDDAKANHGSMYLALLLGESEPTASLYRDALGITGKGPLYV